MDDAIREVIAFIDAQKLTAPGKARARAAIAEIAKAISKVKEVTAG